MQNKTLNVLTDCTGEYQLTVVPWDSRCEVVRWALDLHRANYTEHDVPYGFHLWQTLDDQHEPFLSIPLLKNHNNNSFGGVTSIIMYLYAQAFSGRVRLYSTQDALTEQEYLDRILFPATRAVFLELCLQNPHLGQKYIVDAHHLRPWKVVMEAYWWVISWIYYFYFKIWDRMYMDRNWYAIENCFKRMEENLERNNSTEFMFGKSITAADIAFASYAACVLLPVEDGKSLIGMDVPGVEDVSDVYRYRVEKLRKSKAGEYAMNLYKKHRGVRIAKRPDVSLPEFNTEWSHSAAALKVYVFNVWMLFFIPAMIPFVIGMEVIPTIFYWSAILVCSYYFDYLPSFKGLVHRLNKLRK